MTLQQQRNRQPVRREVYRPGDPLNQTEVTALTCVALGMTNRGIANTLSTPSKPIAEATVAGWLHRAVVKLRAENRAHAVVLAAIKGQIIIPGLEPVGEFDRGARS